MLRKIFICIFVVLLMTTMVVPAFATSIGGEGTGRDKPSIVIDSVKLLDGDYAGSVADWPNNYGLPGGQDEVSVNYPFMGAICSRSEDTFETTLYTGSASSILLSCSNIFWTSSSQFLLDDDQFDCFRITSVTISGYRNDLFEDNNGHYNIMPYSFSSTFSVNATEVNLSNLIRTAVGNIEAYGTFVWLQDVKITINFYNTDPDTPVGLHFSASRDLVNNFFVAWFRDKDLAATINNAEFPGLFDWLKDSVNAFLDIEIAPDLSINAVFYLALVSGLLLFFFRLFS